MADTLKQKIIKALIESLNIPQKEVDAAISLHEEKGVALDRALIEKGLIKEEDMLASLVKELRIPFINLKKYKIGPALKELIAEKVARQYRIIPISRLKNMITVAISDPFNIFVIDDLKSITGHEIDVVMSTESDILEAIDDYYGSGLSSSVKDVTKDIDLEDFEIVEERGFKEDLAIGADEADHAPIIRLVNLVIREALKQRASDVHMEPMETSMRVRFRIDGILHDVMDIPKVNQNAVLVRVKIMSRLDITATRTPQDGRFKMIISGKEIDFRVSLLPTTFGQKIVLRVLDKRNLAIGLEGLGFSGRAQRLLKDGMYKPFGMVLVTGPTGSGKSTTLYSLINQLNIVDRNIITVEEPVEYLMEGLTQIEVRSEIGLTFAAALRSILRQSPDIVMVGEIRDFETADIAVKASLTGQLVFSTLHTNDAAGALTRLVDMGVEPFLVASSLVLVCAQRLCRQLCTHCKKEEHIPEEALKRLNYEIPKSARFFKGEGCDYCRHTGYHGRVGVTEVLEIDETVREMLIKGESSEGIKTYARQKCGMATLWDDILDKLFRGVTSLEEVYRVTSSD